MLSKKLFLALLLILLLQDSLLAADTARLSALAKHALVLKTAFAKSAASFRWIFALIPAVLIGWALSGAFQTMREAVEKSNGQNNSTIIRDVSEILTKLVFGMASIFIVYGIFVRVYADPNGTHSFVYTWNQLVTSFWKDIFK